MTFEEKIEEAFSNLPSGGYDFSGDERKAMVKILEAVRQLVREAKPEAWNQYGDMDGYYNEGIDEYEANLLKALGEEKLMSVKEAIENDREMTSD